MKIVSFWRDQEVRVGILVDEAILDVASAASAQRQGQEPYFHDALSFIRGGKAAMVAAEQLIKQRPVDALLQRDSVKLAPPVLPSTILCAGSNYREHNDEKAGSPTSGKEPEFFLKTADSVVGPEEPIVYDEKLTRKLDCETELAIVIGASGRHIPKDQALEHVFGYTIVNDVTARDRQVRRSGDFTWYELGRGKAFDTSAPLGPWIVTADEIPDPQILDIRTKINGELRQFSNTRNMIWTCADLVHFFSTNFTLKAGMIIITGTPAGTAWSTDRELGGRWEPKPGLVALLPAWRFDRIRNRANRRPQKSGALGKLLSTCRTRALRY
jgi:2-keto-4-pentenoate hydratase/2-oxohepta-3-ene-1,7-dioic acid hydratase in catechol pathway